MSLTVCIPHLRERKNLLGRLLWGLERQTGDYQISVFGGTNRTLGEKLDIMFAEAETTHVVAVDDDDWLSERYMDLVLPHSEDFIGYDVILLFDGRYGRRASHRADVPATDNHPTVRGVSQKCPVRTDIARAIPFPDGYFGDREWSAKVAAEITTHTHIPEPLYFYDYTSQREFTAGLKSWSTAIRDPGPWPYDPTRIRWY